MTHSPCARSELELAELAWGAGFFDGEGSTFAKGSADRPGYLQLCVSVPQRGGAEKPQVLLRFQSAVLGMGTISPPNEEGVHQWRGRGFTDAQGTIGLLWPYLGRVKRCQAAKAMRLVRAQYESGAFRSRRARSPAVVGPHTVHAPWIGMCVDPGRLEHPWAAGFLDAEGCFGLARSRARVRGPAWYRIRVSASQHGEEGVPPDVLVRLQRALGGFGRIERHGEPDDFKWVVEGVEEVERVVAMTRRWLGPEKLTQAQRAITGFSGQVRLKGDAVPCVRGHAYKEQRRKGGRLRRICNACERITARRRRAAKGIAPRQFKNLARRYAR